MSPLPRQKYLRCWLNSRQSSPFGQLMNCGQKRGQGDQLSGQHELLIALNSQMRKKVHIRFSVSLLCFPRAQTKVHLPLSGEPLTNELGDSNDGRDAHLARWMPSMEFIVLCSVFSNTGQRTIIVIWYKNWCNAHVQITWQSTLCRGQSWIHLNAMCRRPWRDLPSSNPVVSHLFSTWSFSFFYWSSTKVFFLLAFSFRKKKKREIGPSVKVTSSGFRLVAHFYDDQQVSKSVWVRMLKADESNAEASYRKA